MKNYRIYISIVLYISVILVFTSCDTSTNTKAVSVSPPSLVSPSDMDSNVSLTPTFTWTGNANRFEISTNAAFSNIVHSAAVYGTSYTMPDPLLPGTFYYWHAGVSGGTIVYWSSDYYTFLTQH
jgi:hypothetical protein